MKSNKLKAKLPKSDKSARVSTRCSEGNPTALEITTLVALFTEGRYNEAEKLALMLTERFPSHGFGWTVLGAVFKQTGRSTDALMPMQKAVTLVPKDADANYNLGVAYQDLGRLAEAEASYRRVLQLKPEYAKAHSHLGNVLRSTGRLDEAEDSYRRALVIMPESSTTHYNLGVTLADMSRLHEAEASYRRALQIKPDLAEALFNLGQTLYYLDDLSHSIEVFQKTFECDPFNRGVDAAIYLATLCYLDGDIEQCQNHLLASKPILEKADIKHKSTRIYWRYLDKLRSRYRQLDRKDYQTQGKRTLHVIGESHSLTAHGVVVRYHDQEMQCAVEWIEGCKQWHLGNNKPNKYKHKFEAVMARLPPRSTILLTIGEIDCRHDEGIIKAWKKYPDKSLAEVIRSTVEGYINYVAAIGERYGHRIIMGGVSAPNISFDTLTAAEAAQFVNLITVFNSTLMEFALAAGMDFLDVYSLTDRGDGIASGQLHIDNYHLLPCAVTEAFAKHCTQSPMAANFMRANSILPPPKGGVFHWKETEMPIIKIDDIDYELDALSEEAKAQLASLQFVDAELARLNALTAVCQTARNTYSAALKELLPKSLS